MSPLALRDLDRRAVLFVAGLLFFGWAALVVVFAWRGQPGVVCLTPVLWLLAVVAGKGTPAYSRSAEPATRRAEAGLAGGLLGVLQGMLFTVMTQVMAPMTPRERLTMALLGVAVTFGGLLVCTVAAFAVAALVERGAGR
jgi:hypothetical protein